ncbi:metalloregulator ArsR/SmtB family transcription factor [Aestuariicella hydrocarbonica]|uniref:Metalloregulator ArsR/SmtB family transcription factor n=1 Tax=Pseudomaricurvus hydrocarbonicus TaxID=1470433 RepID=A0A9E5MNX2_9GAMM|nr:metalloregulator ArsR/SmtB family transcription factor [Aestuariicella hydrocarbonica]NHO67617.1 metalloregulator ArsR/SmtB family transcription factor [Aestuariicella hydrocarbonica]
MSQLLSTVHDAEAPITSDLAATFKAAGDPLRLEILRLLARDSFGVMELSRIFGIKQSGMSHHLKVLANAGLVATRREGNSIFYRRALPGAESPYRQLLASLFQTLDQTPLATEYHHQLRDIQRERAAASQAFFSDNASKFRAQQDLIAAHPVYAEAVTEMLSNTHLSRHQVALEVGPGEGEFLSVLAPRFEQVIALDNSASMLEKARAFADQQQLSNVTFIHGDTEAAVQQRLKADCVVINMVLHHVPSPAHLFDDISQLLNENGCLLVADLCHHDQQWAREACGDVWLGFEPDDFSSWAHHAGLTEGQSQYIALRNGFQIQVRQFFRPQARSLNK